MKSKFFGGVVAALLLVVSLVVGPTSVFAQNQNCQTLFQMLDTHVAVVWELQNELNAAVTKLNADSESCSSEGGLPGSGCSDLILSDSRAVADLSYRISQEQQIISGIQSSLGSNRCSR